jgi:hypothetical protein
MAVAVCEWRGAVHSGSTTHASLTDLPHSTRKPRPATLTASASAAAQLPRVWQRHALGLAAHLQGSAVQRSADVCLFACVQQRVQESCCRSTVV